MNKKISVDFPVDVYLQIQDLAKITGRDVVSFLEVAAISYKTAMSENIDKGGYNPTERVDSMKIINSKR